MKTDEAQNTAGRIALVYALLASILVVATSLYEGTFWNEKKHFFDNVEYVQHSYRNNTSTIIDFALLNPLAIYFILLSLAGFKKAYAHFQRGGELPLYHKYGSIVLSAAVGISTMWFYYSGFIGQTFFTAAFEPDAQGVAFVSMTGWLIFIFTSAVIALLFYSGIEFGNYVLFVRRLTQSDVEFRLPPTVSIDIRTAVTPCVQASYVLTTLFVMILVFVFRDFVQFQIHHSNRLWLLAPYILMCLVLFLPFRHLHRLMKENKEQIVEQNNLEIEKSIGMNGENASSIDSSKLIKSIDNIGKLQVFYNTIPVWPTRGDVMLLPNISFGLSVLTIMYKIIDALRFVGQ